MRDQSGAKDYTWTCPPCGPGKCEGCQTEADALNAGCAWAPNCSRDDSSCAIQPTGHSSGCVCEISGGMLSSTACSKPRFSQWFSQSNAHNPYKGYCQVWGDSVLTASYCDQLGQSIGATTANLQGETCTLSDFPNCTQYPKTIADILSSRDDTGYMGICASTITSKTPTPCNLSSDNYVPCPDSKDVCVSVLDPNCTDDPKSPHCYKMCDPAFFYPRCEKVGSDGTYRCLNGAHVGSRCDPTYAASQCPALAADTNHHNQCCEGQVTMSSSGMFLNTSAFKVKSNPKKHCTSLGVSSQMDGAQAPVRLSDIIAPSRKSQCPGGQRFDTPPCTNTNGDVGRGMKTAIRIIAIVLVAIPIIVIAVVVVKAILKKKMKQATLSSCEEIMCGQSMDGQTHDITDQSTLHEFFNKGQYSKRLFDKLKTCATHQSFCKGGGLSAVASATAPPAATNNPFR